jgi:hypothetical protein
MGKGKVCRAVCLSQYLELIPVSAALNDQDHYLALVGCLSIAVYLPSYNWYQVILLAREKQVELSVLLKDTEKQNVTQPRGPRISEDWQYATTPLLSPLLLLRHKSKPHLMEIKQSRIVRTLGLTSRPEPKIYMSLKEVGD